MADYIVLRASYVYGTGSLIVTAVSGSGGSPAVAINTPISQVLDQLTDEGYLIDYSGSDSSGTTYSLRRAESYPIEFIEDLLGQSVVIETNAGTVTGTLTLVGTDVVQVLEPTGDIVLIPLNSINSVYTT